MSPLSSRSLELQHPPSQWDYVLESLVVVLLAVLPFAFGGRDEIGPEPALTYAGAWTHELFLGLAASMAVVLAARQLFDRTSRFTWSWAYLPIVLFLLLALLQWVSLPARVVGWLSPHTVRTKAELLADLPDAPSLLGSMTLTFYRQATALDLRKLLAVSTVFVVVVNVYRRSWQIKRLLLAISIIGFAVAMLALYQSGFGIRTIYGIVPATHPNSAAFPNHGHFAQFMNLSIGAMLAFVLVKVGEITDGSAGFSESMQLLQYAKLNGLFVLVLMILLSAATVFLCMSRGGVLSMLVAASVTAILFVWRRGSGGARSLLFIFALLALLVVLYGGMGLAFERLASLRNANAESGDRMGVLRDLSVLWRDYPVWGTGLGTHRYVFPMYDRSTVFNLATYAEDEYAQLMEEAGGVGLALCLAFVGIIAACFFRSIWKPRRPVHWAAYGLGFGLLAVLVHSASDFGQHDPANACLTATFAGLLVVLARHARPVHRTAKEGQAQRQVVGGNHRVRAGLRIGLSAAALAGVIAIFALPLRAADVWRRARAEWARASEAESVLVAKGWENGENRDYAALLIPATAAAAIEPDDAFMGYWLNDFRWQAINASRDPHTGALSLPPARVAGIGRIVDELNVVRGKCPTFSPVYALAGQLDYFILDRAAAGESLIHTACRLDQNELTACTAEAQLDASKEQWDASMVMARRALALNRSLAMPGLLQLYVRLQHPERAHELVRDDREGLLTLADMLPSDPASQALATGCRKEASELLLSGISDANILPDLLIRAGDTYEGRGQHRQAIDCYERAVAREDGKLDWRAQLARLLANDGQTDAAEREAKACLRQRPDYAPALAVLDELNKAKKHE